MLTGYWRRDTRWGVLTIQQVDGRWCPLFEGERLRGYDRPDLALDALVGGHTQRPSNGLDPTKAGLPKVLARWTFVRTD